MFELVGSDRTDGVSPVGPVKMLSDGFEAETKATTWGGTARFGAVQRSMLTIKYGRGRVAVD